MKTPTQPGHLPSASFSASSFWFRAILIMVVCMPPVFLALSSHPRAAGIALGVMAAGIAAPLLRLARTAAAMQERDAVFDRMFEAIPCYVLLVDRALRILWTDGMFRRDFGDKRGWTCHRVYKDRDEPCEDCSALMTLQDGGVYSREQTLTTQEGVPMNLLVYSAPLTNEAGEVVAVMEVAMNITSVKEVRKQLILMGQAVAGMAHSIKNIMMGLGGGIYVVNRGLEADNKEEIKEGWAMVQLNFDKIAELVRDILYCAKDRQPDLQDVNPTRCSEKCTIFTGTQPEATASTLSSNRTRVSITRL